jgi:hypothetical protein
MPHGGYHGTVKIGNTTVQQSSRPDGRGGQTGGGQYRAKGYNNKPKKKDLDIINEQRNRLNQIKNTANIDNRSKFLASQTPKTMIADAQQRRIQDANRRRLEERLKTGKSVARSEFTGNYGDGFLGLNIGATQTGRPKIREGMASDEYAKYMSGLYGIAPQRMEGLFPFSSGKTMRNLSRFMPGLGTLQTIAGNVFGKTKSFMGDKLSGIMNTDVGRDLAAAPGGFTNDLLTMLGLNKNKKEGATTETETKVLDAYQDGSITPGRIEQMAPGVIDDINIFEGKSIDPTRQIMDMETLVKKAEGTGLASLIENNKINPVRKDKPPMPKSKSMSAYEQAVAEYMNTYGPGSDLFQKEQNIFDEFGGADLTDFKGKSYDQLDPSDREYIRRIIQISGGSLPYGYSAEMPLNILNRFGTDGGTDFGMFQDSPFRTDNIPADAFSGARSSLIPQAASIIPQSFKDGGSPENYDVLKSINDTMHG